MLHLVQRLGDGCTSLVAIYCASTHSSFYIEQVHTDKCIDISHHCYTGALKRIHDKGNDKQYRVTIFHHNVVTGRVDCATV